MSASSVCPKCGHVPRPSPSIDSCPRCGLSLARWPSWQPDVGSHPVVDAGWQALEQTWDDDAAHALFVDRAADAGGLDLAAARYRAVLVTRRDDAHARAGLERVRHRAERWYTVTTLAGGETGEPLVRWVRWAGALAAFLLTAAVTWLIVVSVRRRF